MTATDIQIQVEGISGAMVLLDASGTGGSGLLGMSDVAAVCHAAEDMNQTESQVSCVDRRKRPAPPRNEIQSG